MDIFNELSESLQEAIEIKKGKRAPARVTKYSPTVVSEIRQQLGVTQADLAKTFGASLESVKSWELGRRHPSRDWLPGCSVRCMRVQTFMIYWGVIRISDRRKEDRN